MRTLAIGVDFGTTNSSIARSNASGEIEMARFSHAGGFTEAYRSLLYLEQVKDRGINRVRSCGRFAVGPHQCERFYELGY